MLLWLWRGEGGRAVDGDEERGTTSNDFLMAFLLCIFEREKKHHRRWQQRLKQNIDVTRTRTLIDTNTSPQLMLHTHVHRHVHRHVQKHTANQTRKEWRKEKNTRIPSGHSSKHVQQPGAWFEFYVLPLVPTHKNESKTYTKIKIKRTSNQLQHERKNLKKHTTQ